MRTTLKSTLLLFEGIVRDVDGPYCDNVDIVLQVDDSGASSKQEWTGMIYATLYFD